MERTDRRLDLESALRELNDRDRSVVVLWAQGYTQQEIADEYGITQQAISLIVKDATCKIRDSIPFNDEGSM